MELENHNTTNPYRHISFRSKLPYQRKKGRKKGRMDRCKKIRRMEERFFFNDMNMKSFNKYGRTSMKRNWPNQINTLFPNFAKPANFVHQLTKWSHTKYTRIKSFLNNNPSFWNSDAVTVSVRPFIGPALTYCIFASTSDIKLSIGILSKRKCLHIFYF